MTEQNSTTIKTTLTESDLAPLFALLDDTDQFVTNEVRRKLVSFGSEVVPFVRQLIQNEFEVTQNENAPTYVNALAVLRGIQQESLLKLMNGIIDAHFDGADIPLEQSVILLSQFNFPETPFENVSQTLNDLALRVHKVFIGMKTANDLSLLMSLNTVFFEQEEFKGATKNYYAPEHSYVSTLLSSKRGIPISLSVLYMLIAERVGIELHGIGMPLHFLVYHPVLNVFIDTFNFGAFISEDDCKQFIKQSGFSYSEKMLTKSTNLSIITRMMRNLIYAHSKYNQKWEAEVLQETLDEILRLNDQSN